MSKKLLKGGIIMAKINAKALKQATLHMIDFDKKRPFTFDFNALAELQEFYDDPLQAMAQLDKMNLKAMRAIVFSGLVAGAMAQGKEFELNPGQVGSFMTGLFSDEERFASLFEIIGEASKAFFPDTEDNTDDVEGEEKNEQEPATK
jgi:hypothetical protein